jgi:bacterioferritin-associated ferredoxin
MYVCVCMAVTEAEVDATIAGGATTREAVTRVCRAGGDCGACHQMIEDKIEDHLEARLAPVHADLVPADALVRARSRAA